jgi:hypothetical protein
VFSVLTKRKWRYALAGVFMRKTLFVVLVLLSSAHWLQAQEGIPGADIWLGPTGPSTVDGCLQSSGGHYTVTGKDGTVTDLTGDTAWLSQYVGREVEITGKPTIRTLDTTVIHAASTAEELPALEVKNAREISKTCKWRGQ